MHIDGCIVAGPLFVIFSDIYMTKTEDKVVKLTNPRFYKRFVDDIISKKKKDQPDLLIENLNNQSSDTKYTIGTMPQEFLTLRLLTKIIKLKPKYTETREDLLPIGHQRFQNNTSRCSQC